MKVSKEQLAVDFALGTGHEYPSFEAQLLEKGFLEGYRAKETEIQKLIDSLEKSKGFGFNNSFAMRFFVDQQEQMRYAQRIDEIIKLLKPLL